MGIAADLGIAVALFWGWSPGAEIVLGLALFSASTVELLRALESRVALKSSEGRIAFGWLIVQDLVRVMSLVLLPTFVGKPAGGQPWGLAISNDLAKVAAFLAVMDVAGRWLSTRL